MYVIKSHTCTNDLHNNKIQIKLTKINHMLMQMIYNVMTKTTQLNVLFVKMKKSS